MYVIDVLRCVREFAPFACPIRDIIAGYAMNVGDLLAYMPNIWEQDDDEPYVYQEHFENSTCYVYVNGKNIRFNLQHKRLQYEKSFPLAGIMDLKHTIILEYLGQYTLQLFSITGLDVVRLSRYYENIARNCLNHLLKSHQ